MQYYSNLMYIKLIVRWSEEIYLVPLRTKIITCNYYLGRSDDANKALSAAVQLHDTLVKAWALWGDYLEALFTRDPTHMNLGVFAITCYLHASRHQNESKSRKYLAKVSTSNVC